MHLKEELEKRWLLNQFSDEKMFDMYDKWWEKFYCGYDPSADSLTIWNLVTFMTAVNFMKKWNTFYLLIWWATWMIWDPWWKDEERNFLDEDTLRNNQESIKKQVEFLLENLKQLSWKEFNFKIVNNFDFYKDMSVIDYLKLVWKNITVNNMIKKETVRNRVEDPDKSISYTEFSYMMLQWWDFVTLFKDEWVKLQTAWWDQWWNCVTWIEMIRKVLDKEAYTMTSPLILDSNWKKFWKSAGNAIWLDKNKNSAYFVYQYFMNIWDNDVDRFLKIYTLLELDEIDNIVKKHMEKPELRYWQSELAKYITMVIFWKDEVIKAEKISKVLFWSEDTLTILENMNDDEIRWLFDETWWVEQSIWKWVLELLVSSWLCSSKSEWRKMIDGGAVFLNNTKIVSIDYVLSQSDLLNWKVWLLRKWKKNFRTLTK